MQAYVLSATAASLETTAGASTTANATPAGYWERIRAALETLAGAASSAADGVAGDMLRAAVAAEVVAGTSGAEENDNKQGKLKRLVDALEVQAGAVTTGSLWDRLRIAAGAAVFGVPFSAAAADGFTLTVAAPTHLSMQPFTVADDVFVGGTAGTATRTEYMGPRINQNYPNHALYTANDVASTDLIMATSVCTGAINNSTKVSPKPVAAWQDIAHETVASTVQCELDAYHYFGIDCVWFRANDGTTQTGWQIVFTKTLSSLCEDKVPLALYRASINVSGLANGKAWREAKVFPRIGVGASVLSSEDNYTAGVSRERFTRRYFRKDTATKHRAYVASTGNDTTGVASTVDATAAASPCLTWAGAYAKLRAAVPASRGSLDGCEIHIVDAVNSGTIPYNFYYQDVGAVVTKRASSSASRAAAALTLSANFKPVLSDHSTGVADGALIFEDMKLLGSGANYFLGEASHPLWCQ
ncbi:MAG: hypothetical protein WBZ57_04235, partial [Pseudomonas graminis]